jgi:DNA polymerase-3 subunit alpha
VRTTATLGEWSEQPVTIGAVVTGVKRQVSKKTGKEYARLTLEDFHGTAEAIVFPDAWAKLNQTILPDSLLLLTGGYSARDRGEDRAPFVVESARRLEELRTSGAVGVGVRWQKTTPPPPEQVRSLASVCATHPGTAPIYIEWSDGNGEAVRLRSRRFRVTLDDELLQEVRGLFGSDAVRFVKTG